MPVARAWHYRPTEDKLQIFVSSRLEECRAERVAAYRAIQSINHQPVLFEHSGARPYSPRDFYLSRLRDSWAMIAIYRDGYGYVDSDNGMTISGVEDEFRFAQENSIQTFFYIHRDKTNRDPRLSALIGEATRENKIKYYDTPDELERAIRDDLTSQITSQIVAIDLPRAIFQGTAKELLLRSARRVGVIIQRPSVISDLSAKSQEQHLLIVCGPAGVGKTILAAQFSEAEDGIFLRVDGLAPKDLFIVCANALRGSIHINPAFTTLDGARQEFVSAWTSVARVVLVVDECEYIAEIESAISTAGGTSADKRAIFTARDSSPGQAFFEVPPLAGSEVEAACLKTRSPVTLQADPLQNNGVSQAQQGTTGDDLKPTEKELESPIRRELLAYLALADSPLQAENFLTLLGIDKYSVESLVDEFQVLKRLIDDSPRGFRLLDAATALVLRAELKSTPQRLRFYVNRLARLYETLGDFRLAYRVSKILNNDEYIKYATPALRQAAHLGDWRLGREIAERLLASAVNLERKVEALKLMLSLIYPLELMGDAARASELLKDARSLATIIDGVAPSLVQEAELLSRARRNLSVSDIEALQALYSHYDEQKRDWDRARIGIELSAIFISTKKYKDAIEVLRSALNTFKDLGDDYGIDIAERNLASSLSAIPGNEAEAERLISDISLRSGEEVDTRRQRAWLCNILVRQYRASERFAEAEAVAREAISIAADLGDEALRAINCVNLGNTYSDQGRTAEAIEAYSIAGVSAQKCGRRDIEADASRLQAAVLNDVAPGNKVFPDAHKRAAVYAEHAIGLLSGSVYYEARGRALEELASAKLSLREDRAAAEALFDAAAEFIQARSDGAFGRALVKAADAALPEHQDVYVRGLAAAIGESKEKKDTLSEEFIALVEPIILKVPKLDLVRLLGVHLQHARAKLPPLIRPAFARQIVAILRGLRTKPASFEMHMRIMYASLIIAILAKDDGHSYLYAELAQILSRHSSGISVRELGDGRRIWTVVLKLEKTVTLSIEPIDETLPTAVSALALAVFLKAFEKELSEELVPRPAIDELQIQICNFVDIPEDLRRTLNSEFDVETILEDQGCVVTRPSDVSDATPTLVMVSPKFLDEAKFGVGVGGSIQILFGLAIIEIVFQLLKGEVDFEQIRPKVISLVRRTLS